ncbi:MAG: hypothetical protein KAW87_01970 [Candidatus Cloacimonetes bacterium]|nr:hypothetical protein [Candidatus Cloacimonadota bacterium]
MDRNILIVDDETTEVDYEVLKTDLEDEANKDSDINIKINIFLVDPGPYIDAQKKDPEEKLEELYSYIDKKYLEKELDMFLCDFNLHPSQKDIAFYIIKHVREVNSTCTIILYSGQPLQQLITIKLEDFAGSISNHIKTQNKSANPQKLKQKLKKLSKSILPASELLEIAAQSKIAAIVSRNDMEDAAFEHFFNPSFKLRLENHLLKYGDMYFNDGDLRLNGLQLKEIAMHIRRNSGKGKDFLEELFELSITHLINMNK